jgi:hypothetical protein
MTRRVLTLLVLGAAACADAPVPCLPLSPECARAQADLRVDVTHIPRGAKLVTATVGSTSRNTTPPQEGGTVTFYFFDVPERADVTVNVDGEDPRTCQAAAPAASRSTGRGKTLELDANGPACARGNGPRDAGMDLPDAASQEDSGVPDAGRVDAGDDDHDGGDDDDDDDGGSRRRDGGSQDAGM